MGHSSQLTALRRRAIALSLVALGMGGCWQEVHYTGPDPSTAARRDTPRRTTIEPPAVAEQDDDLARDAAGEVSPVVEPAPQPAPTKLAESSPDEVSQVAPNETRAELASNDTLFEDVEPESPPPAAMKTPAEPPVSEAPPPDKSLETRLAAWQLGSKLTLAALAHDRGLVPADVTAWMRGARAAAEVLGTSFADLPESSTKEGGDASLRVHEYLLQQGQQIWRDLSTRHGAGHAALFEMAVKSNVLLVLYRPGSPVVEPLASSIRQGGALAELPAPLWQPLLDTLAREAPPAEVRLVVRRMHADVEQYLTNAAEQ